MDLKSLARSLLQQASEENLSFEGHGGVSVPIVKIMESQRFHEQLEAVKKIAEEARRAEADQ
jgi:hypothetical protein